MSSGLSHFPLAEGTAEVFSQACTMRSSAGWGRSRPGFVERAKSEEHEARVTVEAVTLTNMVGPYWNALGTPGTPA